MRSLCVLLLVAACHSPARPAAPPPSPSPPLANIAPPPKPQRLDLDSADILARADTSSPALVKHVLIGWADLADTYRGRLDPRAGSRTHEQAAKVAEEIAAKLRAHPETIDALIASDSEDPGGKDAYTVKDDSAFVPEFKALALRLHVGEVGIVTTHFGYHVMLRVAPPPLDPLESADILARPASKGPVDVRHILIGWKDLPNARDARAKARSKPDADALATDVLARVRAGGDIAALMKQFSEDPGSADSGKAYTVDDASPMIPAFKALALRLNEGEAGLVKTQFGWHVMKRVAPPPPDSLESVAIMQRTDLADHAKVEHILLGWSELNSTDPRATTRTRKQLEKLVKATLARLKAGAKFEALMAELSEDPGSAKTGTSYDVTPDAALVKPFLNLSLRLKVGEVGVVKSDFGIHIIKRVE